MDQCEECGFDFDEIRIEQIATRASSGVAEVVSLLQSGYEAGRATLPPGRWSDLEYAAHVRDVMLTIRDRLVIGLVEDRPGFKPMYREERIELGLYRRDTPDAVAAELQAALGMFLRLFASIEPDHLDRVVQYGFPGLTDRTLLWMGYQVVHEVEHHLADIRENAGPPVSSPRR